MLREKATSTWDQPQRGRIRFGSLGKAAVLFIQSYDTGHTQTHLPGRKSVYSLLSFLKARGGLGTCHRVKAGQSSMR